MRATRQRRMERALGLPLLALALVGAVLLGSGATGMFALSQSCCFGPSCAHDYLCDAAEPAAGSPSPGPALGLILGAAMLGLTLALLLIHRKNAQ